MVSVIHKVYAFTPNLLTGQNNLGLISHRLSLLTFCPPTPFLVPYSKLSKIIWYNMSCLMHSEMQFSATMSSTLSLSYIDRFKWCQPQSCIATKLHNQIADSTEGLVMCFLVRRPNYVASKYQPMSLASPLPTCSIRRQTKK